MAAVQDILSASEVDFNKELSEKQEKIEQMNAKLREASATLRSERQTLEQLQARVSEKNELQRKIGNLTRSANEIRGDIARLKAPSADNGIAEDVQIGDADKGLDLNGTLPAVESFQTDEVDLNGPFTPEQQTFLSSLERAEVLAGRVKAYQKHNQDLEAKSQQLKKTGIELEERYRKMIVACLHINPDEIDEKLPALLMALHSEQKEQLDMGRIRDFLRMLEGSES